jgi:hypothetical protein
VRVGRGGGHGQGGRGNGTEKDKDKGRRDGRTEGGRRIKRGTGGLGCAGKGTSTSSL